MKRIFLSGALLFLASGCIEDEANVELEPNTIAEVVQWQPHWATKPIVSPTFYPRDRKVTTINPGTKVLVLGPANSVKDRHGNITERTLVKVMDGPMKDVVGELPRPHLRDTGNVLKKKSKSLVPKNPRAKS
jgi:hypothetical protein